MSETTLPDSLRGHFVVVNLGSAGDRDYALPASIRAATTLVEVDAGTSSRSRGLYAAKHALQSAVAGTRSTRKFIQRRYGLCSSLLERRRELIDQYGLGRYFEIVSESVVQCERLPDLLNGLDIQSVDFLKTDLEELHFEVIQSCEAMLPQILAIQCELRFQPFYIGEPQFHEVASYLCERGFELIALQPEYWKPRTANYRQHRDGRLAWADCLFMRKANLVTQPLAQAKQVIIAGMVGRRSWAEHLLGQYKSSLPAAWIADLAPVVRAHRSVRDTWIWKLLRRVRTAIRPSEFDHPHVAKW